MSMYRREHAGFDYELWLRRGHTGTPDDFLEWLREGSFNGFSPKDFGAEGNGVHDDSEAIKSAIEAAGEGGKVVLDANTTYLVTQTLELKDGQTFDGNGAKILWETDTLNKNIFSAAGNVGDEIPITEKPRCIGNATSDSSGAANVNGFTYIKVAQNPHLKTGDRIIIQAARCAMQQESGEYWTGTSTGAGTQTYWAEVLVVNDVTETVAGEEWTVRCIGALTYPYYLPTRTADDKAKKLLPALSTASYKAFAYYLDTQHTENLSREHSTIRKANFLKNVCIKNLRIEANGRSYTGDTASSWAGTNYSNTIRLNYCESAVIDNVHINAKQMGRGFAFSNCWRSEYRNSSYEADYRIYAVAETHTYTNAFTFASTWSCSAINCETIRAGQSFDTTYFGDDYDDAGRQLTIGCPPIYTVVRGCTVTESMDSAATNHSGGWGQLFEGCRFINCGRPLCVRSPMTTIKNCTFASYAGNPPESRDPDQTHYQLGFDNYLLEFAEPTCRGGIVEGCSFYGGKGIYLNLYLNRFFNYNEGNYLTGAVYHDADEHYSKPYVTVNETAATARPHAPDRKALGINIHDNVFAGVQGALWIKRSDMWNTDGNGALTEYAKADLGVAFCDNTLLDCGKHFYPIYIEAYINGCEISRNKFIRCVSDKPGYYQYADNAWKGVDVEYLIKITRNNVRMIVCDNVAKECGGGFKYMYEKGASVDVDMGTSGNQLRIYGGNHGDSNVAVAATNADSETEYVRDGKKQAERLIADVNEQMTASGLRHDLENLSLEFVAGGRGRVTVDTAAIRNTSSTGTPTNLLRSWAYIRGGSASSVRWRTALYLANEATSKWEYDADAPDKGESGAETVNQGISADVYRRIAACWNAGEDELGYAVTFASTVVLKDTETIIPEEGEPITTEVCTRWPAPINSDLTYLGAESGFSRYIGRPDPPEGATYEVDSDTGIVNVQVSGDAIPGEQSTVAAFAAIPDGFDPAYNTKYTVICEVIQNNVGKAIRVDSQADRKHNPSKFDTKIATTEKSTPDAGDAVGEVNMFAIAYTPRAQLDLGAPDYPWGTLYADGLQIGGASADETDMKRINASARFVTPEMFGAKGDGVKDDTAAIQAAFDSGYNVRFAAAAEYKLTDTITCTRDIDVDFNFATFKKTSGTMFSFCGSVATTPLSEADYDRGATNYTLATSGYTDYTGMAFLLGTNQLDTHRTYYYAGFAAEFSDGVMTTPYPIDVKNTSVYIVVPVTVHLSNGGSFIFGDSTVKTQAVSIEYGRHCTITGFSGESEYCYEVIRLYRSLHTEIEGCRIIQKTANTSDNNSYLVGIDSSSYTTVSRCDMDNHKWHCISTGGYQLCYSTLIEHCRLFSGFAPAVGDHPNGMFTQIVSCTVTSCLLSYLGRVHDSIICTRADNEYAQISLEGGSDEPNSRFSVTDTLMLPTRSGTNNGIHIKMFDGRDGIDPYTERKFYAKSVDIRNVKATGNVYLLYRASSEHNASGVIGDLNIADSDLHVAGISAAEKPYIDTTNAKIKVSNTAKDIGGTNLTVYGDLILTNCTVPYCKCDVTKLTLNNCELNLSSYSDMDVSDTISGSNIAVNNFVNFETQLDAAQRVLIASVIDTTTGTTYFNVYKNSGGVQYDSHTA